VASHAFLFWSWCVLLELLELLELLALQSKRVGTLFHGETEENWYHGSSSEFRDSTYCRLDSMEIKEGAI